MPSCLCSVASIGLRGMCVIQSVKPGVHNRLLPKIYVNLGITQEADGRLHAACDNYRYLARLIACKTFVLWTHLTFLMNSKLKFCTLAI